MKKVTKAMSFMLIFVLTLSMAFTTGCKKEDNDASKQLVVTVDDKKVYMSDMMYYIYLVELQGSQYDSMYRTYFGTGYWETEYEEGVTIREKMKSYIFDTVVMNEILYDLAKEEGYELTDEEIKVNKENVATLLENITEDQLKVTGFTEKKLLAIQEKLALAYKYQTALVDGFDIDDDAIAADISKEDYRQYDTNYMLFPTSTTDETGNYVALSEDEKKAALKNAETALKEAQEGKAFDEIVANFEGSTTNTLSFVKGDGTTEHSYETESIKLKNDELSGIIETETGYFIVKMVNNNSTESYDKAVADAIGQVESTRFNEEYAKIKEEHKITTNEDVWGPVVLGNITIKEAKTVSAGNSGADAAAARGATGETTTDETTDKTTTEETTKE